MDIYQPTRIDPHFCYIAPINYLTYTHASTTHLVLAHLVDRSDQYAEFYKNRSKNGDFIMMDNSAYELKEPYAPDKLIQLAEQCGAHAIVLPDYPFQQSSKTIEAAEKFAPIFRDGGYKTFFVPQSERGDLDDWISAYVWASENQLIDIIGLSILGVPNALEKIDPSYARVVMVSLLKDRGLYSDKYHHALGLNAGPGLEIPSLVRMGAINSIDSSGPIWAAILGHKYTNEADSLQQVSKLKLPVDFDIKLTKDQATISRIINNVNMTRQLFTQTEQSDWYAKE